MKFHRVHSGYYLSEDGRIVIHKERDHSIYQRRQYFWAIHIDGHELFLAADTKAEAVTEVIRYLKSHPEYWSRQKVRE